VAGQGTWSATLAGQPLVSQHPGPWSAGTLVSQHLGGARPNRLAEIINAAELLKGTSRVEYHN
jgi:hypothetical protein